MNKLTSGAAACAFAILMLVGISHGTSAPLSHGTMLVSPARPIAAPAPAIGVRPEYTVDSGWVIANQWDDGWAGCTANELTYRMPVLVPSPHASGVLVREEISYRYIGTIALNASAHDVAMVTASAWQAFWLGDSPNQIGGPQWGSAQVPIQEPAFTGVSAGQAGFLSALQPGDSQYIDETRWTAETADGGHAPAGMLTQLIPRARLPAESLVAGVPASDLWFTPTMVDLWDWDWLHGDDAAAWTGTHSPVLYGVQVLERIVLHIQEIQ